MSFNPLAVDKLGEKAEYPIEEVEKVLLSTDGAAPRFRELFNLESNEQVVKYIEKHGAQKSLKKLREKENNAELNALKSSDDAAIALLNF
jgi:hypothetical protein